MSIEKKVINNKVYYLKNGVIQDKKCPECKKLLLEDEDFCECGCYLKSKPKNVFWMYFLSLVLIVGSVSILAIIKLQDVLSPTGYAANVQGLNLKSVTPVDVRVLSGIQNKENLKYFTCIQSVYQRQNKENELVVLIKPNCWNMMQANEKAKLLDAVSLSWINVYMDVEKDNQSLKPLVGFANK